MTKSTQDSRVTLVLKRLDGILEAENEALGTDPAFDVNASNIRKSKSLYELSALVRSVPPGEMTESHAVLLQQIHTRLELNAIRVKAHMDAVQQVTELLRDAAKEAEADGTYTAEQFYMREAV